MGGAGLVYTIQFCPFGFRPKSNRTSQQHKISGYENFGNLKCTDTFDPEIDYSSVGSPLRPDGIVTIFTGRTELGQGFKDRSHRSRQPRGWKFLWTESRSSWVISNLCPDDGPTVGEAACFGLSVEGFWLAYPKDPRGPII